MNAIYTKQKADQLIGQKVLIQMSDNSITNGLIIDVYFEAGKGVVYDIETTAKKVVTINPNQVKVFYDKSNF
jgi:hypothetical protein